MINYKQFFSSNANLMRKSEIRELLKLTRKPGIISFAGGLPAPDLFPVEETAEIIHDLMKTEGQTMLQYGPTEGDMGLREELVKLLNKEGIDIPVDQLFVITSSQQGLDLMAKIFLNPGDIILTGKPTYVGALGAFNAYGADVHGIELDEQGIKTDDLEKEVIRLSRKGRKPRAIYVIPDFQNPSGITVTLERRRELVRLVEDHDLILIEDSPYRQLRFEGEPEPPILSLNSDRVVSLYTFSKILLPGFRLGWMAGPAEIITKAIIAKQSVDLCAPPFNQAVIREFLKRGLLDGQIKRIVAAYKEKRDYMLAMLEKYMPKLDGLSWTKPSGGLFLWLTVPEGLNTNEMFLDAISKEVAYVVGSAFDPEGLDAHSMRLNFSYPSMDQIEEGVKRLANVILEASKAGTVETTVTP